VMFFLCLYLASLSASIGLLEVIVSNTMDWKKVPRQRAAWGSGAIALFLAMVPAFSGLLIPGLKMGLEKLDFVLINLFLPLIAAGLSVAVTYGLTESEKRKNFIDQDLAESVSLYPHWKIALRWVVPGVLILAFLLQAWAWLR